MIYNQKQGINMNLITSLNSKEFDVLSKEEIEQLFRRYQKGDKDAYTELINHNLRLVKSIAQDYYFYYQPQFITLDDLFQEGVEGLICAIQTFDISLNYALSTYATSIIKQRIETAILKTSTSFKVTIRGYHQRAKLNGLKKELEAGQKPVNLQNLSQTLNLPPEEVNAMLQTLNITSLNKRIDDDESDELQAFVSSSYDLEQTVINASIKREIQEYLSSALSPKQKTIFEMYHEHNLTLKQIAKHFNLTSEGVRIILQGIYIKLIKLGLFNQPRELTKLSQIVKKIKFQDYFLGIRLNTLQSYILTLPTNYQKIISKSYNSELCLISSIENKPLLTEVIPYIFNQLFEQVTPFFKLFKGLSIQTLHTLIAKNKLYLIYNRYGNNLDEINPLSISELKKLYCTQIPILYNDYLDKQNEYFQNKHLILTNIYPDLTLEELYFCINQLPLEEQQIIFKMYGPTLDEYNSKHKCKNIIQKLYGIINDYIKVKQPTIENEVIVIASAKTLIQRYSKYSLDYLKSRIDTLPNPAIIYERYGETLNELNSIPSTKRKMLMQSLKDLEEALQMSEETVLTLELRKIDTVH